MQYPATPRLSIIAFFERLTADDGLAAGKGPRASLGSGGQAIELIAPRRAV